MSFLYNPDLEINFRIDHDLDHDHGRSLSPLSRPLSSLTATLFDHPLFDRDESSRMSHSYSSGEFESPFVDLGRDPPIHASRNNDHRRHTHAASDARRRSSISQLQRSLTRIIATRIGRSKLTTEQALEKAIEMLEHRDHAPQTRPQNSFLQRGAEPFSSSHIGYDATQTRQISSSNRISRPLLFNNSYLHRLTSIMELSIQHFRTGSSFHPSLPNFRPTQALQSMLASGGTCAILATDMTILDLTHDVGITNSEESLLTTKPTTDCSLRFSDSPFEPKISYQELADMLQPIVADMTDAGLISSPNRSSNLVMQSGRSVLIAASYSQFGRQVRSLKLMTLLRYNDGRPPVLMAVQFQGLITWSS